MKIWMTSVTLTFELLTSWALFVPHMNMIHEIGNEPDTVCGMDRQMDRWMDRSETNMPHNFVVWGVWKWNECGQYCGSLIEWTWINLQTDGQTDNWADKVKPIYPPSPSHPNNYTEWGYNYVNSLRPRDAYMRQWTGPSLVQTMACRLLGAKPLSELVLTYSQLDHKEQNSVKY